jgi:hypothetical protein
MTALEPRAALDHPEGKLFRLCRGLPQPRTCPSANSEPVVERTTAGGQLRFELLHARFDLAHAAVFGQR